MRTGIMALALLGLATGGVSARPMKTGPGLRAGSRDGGVAFTGRKGNWNIWLTSTTKAPTVYAVTVCGAHTVTRKDANMLGAFDDTRTHEGDCETLTLRTGRQIDRLRLKPGTAPITLTITQDGRPVGRTFLRGARPQGEGRFALPEAGRAPVAQPDAPALPNAYRVDVHWGGPSNPTWHPDGEWVLGGREDQPVIAATLTSADGGQTLTGTIQYRGEGPIGFRGTHQGSRRYAVQVQWGGDAAPWHPDGTWIIGGRDAQRATALTVTADGDHGLAGTMQYAGEGPIDWRGR